MNALLSTSGVDIKPTVENEERASRFTLMHVACTYGHPEVVSALISKDRTYVNRIESMSPLLVACSCGQLDVVNVLLSEEGLDYRLSTDEEGCTPLYMACLEGHLDVVKALVRSDRISTNGIEGPPAISGYCGDTSLMAACKWGHVEVVKYLLSIDGIDVNHTIEDDTPLHIACRLGRLHVVNALLSFDGVDVNKKNLQRPHLCLLHAKEAVRIS